MTLPDNRMRFPAPAIDFATEVGTTGQDHDNYPAPGQQPRADWARMSYIAFLSNQSSHLEPVNYREGTQWFDLNTLTMKVRSNNQWVSTADVIAVVEGIDTEATKTLSEWYTETQEILATTTPIVTFSGSSNANGVVTIPIPLSLQPTVGTNIRPFVYRNGMLIDPRKTPLSGLNTIALTSGESLGLGDDYTVVLNNIVPSKFHTPDVNVP